MIKYDWLDYRIWHNSDVFAIYILNPFIYENKSIEFEKKIRDSDCILFHFFEHTDDTFVLRFSYQDFLLLIIIV